MAKPVITHLDAGEDTGSSGTFVTNSQVVSANGVLMLVVVATASGTVTSGTVSVSGCGATWTSKGSVVHADRRWVELFVGTGTLSNGQITITANTNNGIQDIAFILDQATGQDSSPFGPLSSAETKTLGTVSLTLGAATLDDVAWVCGLAEQSNDGLSVDNGNYVNLVVHDQLLNVRDMRTWWDSTNSPEVNPTFSINTTAQGLTAIGMLIKSPADKRRVELAEDAAGTNATEHPYASWDGETQITLDTVGKQGLTGSTFYFRVTDRDGFQSEWYGPVAITDGANNDIVATTSVDFSESAGLNALGSLQAAASVDFSETAELTGLVEAIEAAAVGLAFSETAALTGQGALTAAVTGVVFTETAALNAIAEMQVAIAGLEYTEIADLSGQGALAAAATIDFSELVSASALGALVAAASVDFSETAALTEAASNDMTAAVNALEFTETASLKGQGSLSAAATGVEFTETLNLTALGSLVSGVSGLTFSESATIQDVGTSFMEATVSALVFTESAQLNAPGSMVAAASIDFTESLALKGVGTLVGADVALTFTESADLIAPAANDMLASTAALTFSETAALGAIANIEAATAALTFTESAQLFSIEIAASVVGLAFDEDAALSGSAGLSASTQIDFTETLVLSGEGVLRAAESFGFTTQAIPSALGQLRAAESIAIGESADLNAIANMLAAVSGLQFTVSPTMFDSNAPTYIVITLAGAEPVDITLTGSAPTIDLS